MLLGRIKSGQHNWFSNGSESKRITACNFELINKQYTVKGTSYELLKQLFYISFFPKLPLNENLANLHNLSNFSANTVN